jgi:hypothetical protein
MSTAIGEKRLSTERVEQDVRQPGRQSKAHPDCRSTTIKTTRHENIAYVIAVPRQSSSRRDCQNGHPDCRCVPIQIVALQQLSLGVGGNGRALSAGWPNFVGNIRIDQAWVCSRFRPRCMKSIACELGKGWHEVADFSAVGSPSFLMLVGVRGGMTRSTVDLPWSLPVAVIFSFDYLVLLNNVSSAGRLLERPLHAQETRDLE